MTNDMLRYPCRRCTPAPLTRRAALCQMGAGFGGVALAGLLAEQGSAATSASPLAAKPTHFQPSAKRVIMLFMDGGPSHHDLFDYKPQLIRDHGKPLPF